MFGDIYSIASILTILYLLSHCNALENWGAASSEDRLVGEASEAYTTTTVLAEAPVIRRDITDIKAFISSLLYDTPRPTSKPDPSIPGNIWAAGYAGCDCDEDQDEIEADGPSTTTPIETRSISWLDEQPVPTSPVSSQEASPSITTVFAACSTVATAQASTRSISWLDEQPAPTSTISSQVANPLITTTSAASSTVVTAQASRSRLYDIDLLMMVLCFIHIFHLVIP